MSGVNLGKAIHWPQAINKMPSLIELHLSHTQLPPIINPTLISNISYINSSTCSLVVLDLSHNDLTSSIYPWLFNLFSTSSVIVHLDLSHNDLPGSIPDAFGNMTTLENVHLSFNQIEGEIPKSLRGLCNLQRLYLSHNNLTSGLFEKDFLACSNNTLEVLDVGIIPTIRWTYFNCHFNFIKQTKGHSY